jgi:hypothetical protein
MQLLLQHFLTEYAKKVTIEEDVKVSMNKFFHLKLTNAIEI